MQLGSRLVLGLLGLTGKEDAVPLDNLHINKRVLRRVECLLLGGTAQQVAVVSREVNEITDNRIGLW